MALSKNRGPNGSVLRDERTVQEKNSLAAQGFLLLFFGLFLSILYRQKFLHQSIGQYPDIVILFFLGGIYFVLGFLKQRFLQR